jgi:hypothetical protein
MALNPNYPVIEELWGPSWTAAGGSLPATRWVNAIDRTLSQASARRGKQYELDQSQAGEYNIVLGSQDGALDPTNIGGPYGGRILPYQPYRRRAQWPPTANLLAPEIATAGEGFSAGSFPASWGLSVPSGSVTGTIAVLGSGQAWQGTNVISLAVANGTSANSGLLRYDSLSVRPGKKVTFSLWVANTTAATSQNILPHIDWLAADGSSVFGAGSGTVINGASGTPSWQRLTVTATAPTTGNVYGMRIGINLGTTATAASTIVVDGLQVEWGSAATSWVSPGTWYPIFSGFTERWPSQWAEGGTYGQVSPTAVDAFALLSQVTLDQPFADEIQQYSPRFLYRLAEASGSTTAQDSTSANPAAPLAYGKAGTGNWTFGNSAPGTYLGTNESVLSARPAGAGVATNSPATMLELDAVGINGPANPQLFTRMIAFRYAGGTNPTDGAYMWSSIFSLVDNISVPNLQTGFHLLVDTDGRLKLKVNQILHSPTVFDSGKSVTDGQWHLAAFSVNGTTVTLMLDGATVTGTLPVFVSASAMTDNIGAWYWAPTKTAQYTFYGDLAYATEFPSALTGAQFTALFNSWKSASQGDTSDQRYARILRYAGFTGTSTVGAGLTTSMGPADDLAGSDAMSALNNVVATENGEHFVAADGSVVFRGRGARYNALTPALTLGDGPGELPYEDLQLDFDSTHLGNDVIVTQQGSGANFPAVDSASIAAYYTRTMTRTLNTTSTLECQDAADYLVGRYKQPLTRVQSIRLHPSANPSLWPLLLALELGTRVRINRRPPGAPIVTVDCFVEQIQWDVDGNNEAMVTLQCSPVDPAVYGTFGAWSTTLGGTGVAIGGTVLTVNAGSDGTNPLAAQISAGAQLKLEPGTGVAETVTVLNVGASSPGWSTATITLAAGTVRAHAAGTTVGELLPSGVTSAIYADTTKQFDQEVFAY